MPSNEPKPLHKIHEDEHDEDTFTKKVLPFGWDSDNLTARRLKVDSEGRLVVDGTIDITETTGINGGPVTVGTTAVEMTFTGTTQSICLKSSSTNTGRVWFGPATVDNTGANAYGELTADSAVTLELNDASAAIYCCSDTAAQTVYKVALT